MNMFEARKRRGKLFILMCLKTLTLQSCKACRAFIASLNIFHLRQDKNFQEKPLKYNTR
jgi:hypothetical protein